MKTFTICTAMAIFAAISHAAPFKAQARNDRIQITFQGAPPEVAFFTQYFPVDGTKVPIYDPLSISHIKSDAAGVTCTFYGIDGSVTTVFGGQTVDVGPPQTQIAGSCTAY